MVFKCLTTKTRADFDSLENLTFKQLKLSKNRAMSSHQNGRSIPTYSISSVPNLLSPLHELSSFSFSVASTINFSSFITIYKSNIQT